MAIIQFRAYILNFVKNLEYIVRVSLLFIFAFISYYIVVYYLHTHACVFRTCQLKETTTVETMRWEIYLKNSDFT